MKSSLMLDDFQKERDSHTVGPTSMGKGSEVSHEQYEVSTVKKQLMLEFFRNIDRRINEVLTKDNEAIPGNLEQTRTDDIRQKAWRIVERATA